MKLRYVDIGAGSGHFVRALQELNCDAVGIEADVHQVRYANELFKEEVLRHCKSENLEGELSEIDADVVTCIYGFEHIVNIVEIFDAINKNSHVKWLFFAVPMFSVGSMLDSVGDGVYSRVLNSSHTHIFSNESIDWICKRYRWSKEAEWRFGADASDLLRNIVAKAVEKGDIEYARTCKEMFVPMIDELQSVIDKYEMCSDIHMLVRKLN